MKVTVTTDMDIAWSLSTCVVVPSLELLGILPGSQLLSGDQTSMLKSLAGQRRISGKEYEIYFLAEPHGPSGGILAIGLGDSVSRCAEVLRRGMGKACAVLASNRITHVVFDGTCLTGLPVEALVEGLMLGQYDFARYKEAPADPPVKVDTITICVAKNAPLDAQRAACERATVMCDAATWARDLANTPPNDMTPTALSCHAAAMAREAGCECTVLDESEMQDLGMGAILGVSRGSGEPAKLIIVEYRHPTATKTLALVGKGLTFDTGGISIKPSTNMHEMKYDMCGAAGVLGAMKAIAALKPVINVVAVVPSSENMPGSNAQVPGDIVKAYNGKTIEVHNTDAEGRLILADALAYTVDKYKPDAIVDAATLTGAGIVALGHYAAGVLGNNDDLTAGLQRAADSTGERIWPMPMWDDYAELIKGTHADLCNIGPQGEAGTIIGACFLKEFVGDVPWAHLDIAGTAWGVKNVPYLDPKHATGYGVRLFAQWVLDEARGN